MSGRKNVLLPYQIITNGDMLSDVTSTEVNLQYLDNTGIEVSWSGTPTGTFAVECTVSGAVWQTLTFDPPLATAAGSPGAFLINCNQLPFTKIRLTYSPISGAGTLNAYMTIKEI